MSALTVPAPIPLRDDLVASLYRFLKITFGSIAALVGLWLISSMLAPGNDATPMITPANTPAGGASRTAGIALVAAGKPLTVNRSSGSAKNRERSTSGGNHNARGSSTGRERSKSSTETAAAARPARATGRSSNGRPRPVERYSGNVTCRGNCDPYRDRDGSLSVECKGNCDIRVGKRTRAVSEGRSGRARVFLARENGKRQYTSVSCGGSECSVTDKAKGKRADVGKVAKKRDRGSVKITRYHRDLGSAAWDPKRGEVELKAGGKAILRDSSGLIARADNPRGFPHDAARIDRIPENRASAGRPDRVAGISGLGVVSAGRGNTARSTGASHGNATIAFYQGVQHSSVLESGNINLPATGHAWVRPMRDGAMGSEVELVAAGAGKPAHGEIRGRGSMTVKGETARIDSDWGGDVKRITADD